MKKLVFLIFIFIFLLFAGIGYAFHIKSIDPFMSFNDYKNKHIPKDKPVETINKTNSGSQKKENDKNSLYFSFAGDVLLDGHVASLIKEKGSSFILSDVKSILSSSDISMLNLEDPISLRGTKANDKQYTFRVNPKYVDVLTSSGIDIVTLANNHALDYGKDALLDTFDYLDKAGIEYTGAGRDINRASGPVILNKKGFSTAILASSHVIPETSWAAGVKNPGLATTYNPARILSEIAAAKKNSDIVVVYIHWGEELSTKPVNYQKNLARMYIDRGADIVIGSHPHVLQGFEYYKGKLIAYSLGNFIFTDIKKDTLILNIKYSGDSYTASIVPCRIEKYRPVQIKDKTQQKSFFENLESLSFNVQINGNGEIKPKE